MAKKPQEEPEQLNLGDWLEYFEMGPSEAAKLAGCSQSYISNISGSRKENVNVLYLLRLSRKLGVTVNDFYQPAPSKAQAESLAKLSEAARETIIKRAAGRG